MGMFPLWAMFPEIAEAETRTVRVPEGNPVPADTYALVELYCIDPGCDCRRVMVNVIKDSESRHVATINHAFDPEDSPAAALGQTFLDPLNEQTDLGPPLLALFKLMLLDHSYWARLERHYQLVKAAVRDPADSVHQRIRDAREAVRGRGRKVGRNEPCPCGSGRKLKHC